MAFKFRRTKRVGPFQFSASKRGIGKSIGLFGFRIGVSPDGRKYWSFGIKGTGFYWINYF